MNIKFWEKPVLDVETMVYNIALNTGIDITTIWTVINAEEAYLIKIGIAEKIGGDLKCQSQFR